MPSLGEASLSEERESLGRGSARLRCRETEQGGTVCWDAEQLDRDLSRRFWARIASDPLGPREARVRTLRPGEDRVRSGWQSGGWRQAHFKALVPHELDTGTPMFSAAPISPEQWCGADAKRMQQHTDLARLCGSTPIPLALLTERARAAAANAGRIHDAQAPISFSTPFMGKKRLPCGTPERPIRLERKISSGETTCFEGGSGGR